MSGAYPALNLIVGGRRVNVEQSAPMAKLFAAQR